MSYTKGTLIYGVPISKKLSNLAIEVEEAGPEHPLFEHLEPDYASFKGFKTLYLASGDWTPGYFGEVVREFDVVTPFTAFTDLLGAINTVLKPEMIERVHQDYLKLPAVVWDLCEPLGCYIIWWSS